ncbi:hypothetical protein FW778_13355 [Ginsengibacter hankyongi]|uniref:Uncharacterized protein n=1 Tax=Ginsengibacter hankyongi TaxID=2607284 RepID=A0A5J5IGN9_9BACT|nr:hypothetical protein [Ginsengibacter hankyongi]KAA9038541.1 hypothetical protein FW778_13355 [Ginsengibacter hankyongi]
MKLECKEISISDDEFGCTIEFLQEKEEFDGNIKKSAKEILASIKPYILLQRTYGEDEFEEDYYYFETHDFDKAGELKDFTINIYRKKILITRNNEIFEIAINSNNIEFENLKRALGRIANKEGQLQIYE